MVAEHEGKAARATEAGKANAQTDENLFCARLHSWPVRKLQVALLRWAQMSATPAPVVTGLLLLAGWRQLRGHQPSGLSSLMEGSRVLQVRLKSPRSTKLVHRAWQAEQTPATAFTITAVASSLAFAY